jgi:hypothetical protein
VRGSRGCLQIRTTYSKLFGIVSLGRGSGRNKGGYPRARQMGEGDDKNEGLAKMVPQLINYPLVLR